MNYKQILSILNNEKQLSSEEIGSIKKHFHFTKSRKKEIILNSNSICDKIFFVNNGIIRAYYTNDKGNVITRMIAAENQFLTNMISFRNFGKNIETFECLEDAEYLYISRKELNALLESSKKFRDKYCEILEHYNAIHIKHIHAVSCNDIISKIEYLKIEFPHLINRISDEILASFLGSSRIWFTKNKKFHIS